MKILVPVALSLTLFVSFPVFPQSATGNTQDNPKNDKPKTEDKKPTPTPIVVAPPAMPPDQKAYFDALREKDPEKRIALLEKSLVDFPNSFNISTVQMSILTNLIAKFPDQKDRILSRANLALESAPEFLKPTTYASVASSLLNAGFTKEAEDIANKGLILTEETLVKDAFQRRYSYWLTLGQIALKNNDLKKAEPLLLKAISGDYSGNAAPLSLAELYEKKNKPKEQLEYLVMAAVKGTLKTDNRQKLDALYGKFNKGKLDGLNELLDQKYRALNPPAFTYARYSPSEKRSNRIVLAELFTGSACPPCVAADLGFEALLGKYSRNEVAVLIYHLHIPGPDPMTNLATVGRAKFYAANSTPTFIVDGATKETGGGGRTMAKGFFDRLTPKIDKQLEAANNIDLKLSASMANGIVKANASVENVKDNPADLKLHIILVEHEISYSGENGIRFHPMVVRELGGESRNGFILKDKSSNIEWQFDVQKISDEWKQYLDKYEVERSEDSKFAFTEKKNQLNQKNLAVVAFVQNEKTKEVLQTIFVDLAPQTTVAKK